RRQRRRRDPARPRRERYPQPRGCYTRGESAMAVKTMIEAIRDGLREEMERDDRVFVLGEDVGPRGGVFGVTDGFTKQFGTERVLDTPLAESVIAGAAIGAAMNGMRPVAEIQFADFSHPAMDQIMNEAAKIRYRSNND